MYNVHSSSAPLLIGVPIGAQGIFTKFVELLEEACHMWFIFVTQPSISTSSFLVYCAELQKLHADDEGKCVVALDELAAQDGLLTYAAVFSEELHHHRPWSTKRRTR